MTKLLHVSDRLMEIVILAILSMAVGVLLFKKWRETWLTPTAGLLLGMMFGYGASGFDSTALTVGATLFGVVVGPGLVIAMNGTEVSERLAQTLLDRINKQG